MRNMSFIVDCLLIRSLGTYTYHLFNEHTFCTMTGMKLNGLAVSQYSSQEPEIEMVIYVKKLFPSLLS